MEPTEGSVGEANEEESLLRRMGCEMVSNAALRSRRMRMEIRVSPRKCVSQGGAGGGGGGV